MKKVIIASLILLVMVSCVKKNNSFLVDKYVADSIVVKFDTSFICVKDSMVINKTKLTINRHNDTTK